MSSVNKERKKKLKLRRKLKAESADHKSMSDTDLSTAVVWLLHVFVVIHLDAGRLTDLNALSS